MRIGLLLQADYIRVVQFDSDEVTEVLKHSSVCSIKDCKCVEDQHFPSWMAAMNQDFKEWRSGAPGSVLLCSVILA